ncbi:protein arginine kinase [Salinicoccus albus]|uniref:protein arginine kinase n=1 Tax=Salinicoccus albus TaxID=418756 RepID=UPI000369B9D5|nr:protein arginine kinase [Salinicoccus albus]
MEHNNISPWIEVVDEAPVEMSARVRLARNLQHVPFPHVQADKEKLDPALSKIEGALSEYQKVPMEMLQFEDKALLVEKYLISPLFTKQGICSYVNDDESVSVMVNEEDHIRIQSMGAGIPIQELYQKAEKVDETLEDAVDYAFDEQYGYLTACPTNTGTGMRASVMLHLPALSLSGKIDRLAVNLGRFGFTLRGIYGEGSVPLGHIYQLSNQLTLGQTEEDIIQNLDELKSQVVEEELETRSRIQENHALEIKDSVHRAFGTLKHAYKMSLKEAAKCLSEVKLGIDLGIIDYEDFKFQKWVQLIQPAFLKMRLNITKRRYRSLEAAVDEERATLLRELSGGK